MAYKRLSGRWLFRFEATVLAAMAWRSVFVKWKFPVFINFASNKKGSIFGAKLKPPFLLAAIDILIMSIQKFFLAIESIQ